MHNNLANSAKSCKIVRIDSGDDRRLGGGARQQILKAAAGECVGGRRLAGSAR